MAAAVVLSAKSRLLFGTFTTVDGVEFFDILQLPSITEQTDDTTYEWKSNDHIDIVANRFYGDSMLWWVIAVANNIELVPIQLNEGQLLRIPAPRYVSQVLLPLAKSLARAQQ